MVKPLMQLSLLKERYLVNKSELVDRVAANTAKTKKEAGMMVDAVLKVLSSALENGEKVTLIGFGNFEVRERAARTGRNPQTGKEIQIQASKVPAFRAGKYLKELVNKS